MQTETINEEKPQKKTAAKTSKKEKRGLKYWCMLNLGILMLAVGIYFFKAPNGFATGGVSGLSIVISKLFPALSQATVMLVINVILLVVGWLILGRECGIMTVFCSVLLSLENLLLETFIPISAPLTAYPLMELVYAVLLTGIGSAMIFKCKASSGGTDIVALILKKYTHMDVGKALLVSDAVIAASTFFVYGDVTIGLFSVLGLFAKVFIVDDILDSINMCKAFTIITTKAKEIDDYIMRELNHSATVISAKGAYTGEEREMITTVCRRSEALKLRIKVKEIDPHAFIIITKTSEIMGKGFRDNLN
ncbi:MAG: YitT family protein [Clostridia bacterium]|nr:YitT family protein [Clostridia bacterium]